MQGLIDSVRQTCNRFNPRIPFLLYTPTRFVVSRNGATLNFRLACEIVRTEGNQKTIEDVKRIKESQMEIDEDSLQVKYVKILNSIKAPALNHCPECMEKYESFKTESDACEVLDINHYHQRISDLSKAGFHFDLNLKQRDDLIFDEFYDKRTDELIQYFTNTPAFDFIFAFEYYDKDEDCWKIKSFDNFENIENKMKGSDYLLELLS